jgi:hypothetical protein
MEDITTLWRLRSAIDAADAILVQPRFQASEKWVEISRDEALSLIAGQPEPAPEDIDLYAGMFGRMVGPTLYLG